jgi:hypothetical protein
MSNTILLKGRGIRKEAVAGGAITPGHLLTLDAAGELIVHATAGGYAAPLFAVENDLEGKTIDDAYAADDFVQAEYMWQGFEVYALVPASAAAIVIGDLLESVGDGTLKILATGVAVAQALEAVDNSVGGTPARIKVVII